MEIQNIGLLKIKMYQDDPEMVSIEKIVYNSFVNHPIRIPIIHTIVHKIKCYIK